MAVEPPSPWTACPAGALSSTQGVVPTLRPNRFRLINKFGAKLAINLKTAKTLGLTVPEMLLARADEVIE
jgi:hypothetical protein